MTASRCASSVGVTPRVPKDTTLLRWANLNQSDTIQRLLDHVVALARQQHITRGRKLWLDSTVVETNVRYPVDRILLADGVRVLARTIRRAKPLLEGAVERARTMFRDRTCSVRRVTRHSANCLNAAHLRQPFCSGDCCGLPSSGGTLAQRLVRAKRKIKHAVIPYSVPPTHLLAGRLDLVLGELLSSYYNKVTYMAYCNVTYMAYCPYTANPSPPTYPRCDAGFAASRDCTGGYCRV